MAETCTNHMKFKYPHKHIPRVAIIGVTPADLAMTFSTPFVILAAISNELSVLLYEAGLYFAAIANELSILLFEGALYFPGTMFEKFEFVFLALKP